MADIKGRCEPAYSIVVKLGGVGATARICGLTTSAVSRWLSKAGTGGDVPVIHWKKLIVYARTHGVAVDLHDLSGITR
jgi:hypothetical protein